jgi:hypothetical protein
VSYCDYEAVGKSTSISAFFQSVETVSYSLFQTSTNEEENAMANASEPAVLARLEKLEKQNRRLRWLASLALLLASLLALNLAWAGLRIGRFAKVEADTAQARHFVLRAGPSEDAHFTLYDHEGIQRVLLRANDLSFMGQDQQNRLWINANEGGGGIQVNGRNGENLAGLSAGRDDIGNYHANLIFGFRRADQGRAPLRGPTDSFSVLVSEGHSGLWLTQGKLRVGLFSEVGDAGLLLQHTEAPFQDSAKFSVTPKGPRFTLYDKFGNETFAKP